MIREVKAILLNGSGYLCAAFTRFRELTNTCFGFYCLIRLKIALARAWFSLIIGYARTVHAY
jgi:hypothetical protein